jgi:hypothetical protein
MSVQAITSCWGPEFPTEAEGVGSAMVRLTALAIADVVNDMHDNQFYGSLPRLADKIGASRESVRKAVAHLVAAGVITLVREVDGRATIYRWTWPNPAARLGGTHQDVEGGTHQDVSRPPTKTSRADTNVNTKTETQGDTQPPAAPRVDTDHEFAAFWSLYPRKVAKPEAEARWRKIMRPLTDTARRLTASTILQGVEAWNVYWTARNEPEFVPFPATWLNRRSWEDTVPVHTPSTARPTGRNAGTFGDQDLMWAAEQLGAGTTTNELQRAREARALGKGTP